MESLIEDATEPVNLLLKLRNWTGQHPVRSRDWGSSAWAIAAFRPIIPILGGYLCGLKRSANGDLNWG